VAGETINQDIIWSDDYVQASMSGEEKLWWAVITLLLRDIEDCYRAICAHRSKHGDADSILYAKLSTLKHEARSAWLGEVMEYLNWHPKILHRAINKLEERYLGNSKFPALKEYSTGSGGSAINRVRRGYR